MFSPFQVSPLETTYPILPLPASMRVLPHPPIHSHGNTPAFSYTGALNLHRTKEFLSH